MGGASTVLTADTRQEVIEEAKKWYIGAMSMGLYPRDYIYGKGDVEIEFQHCKSKACHFCGGVELSKANIFVVDNSERPENAESEHPFSFYSSFLSEEDRRKRFFAFVSAHA